MARFCTACVICITLSAGTAAAAGKPHVVVILADDLGNADLGYRGSSIKTPHLDALAAGGTGWRPSTASRPARRRGGADDGPYPMRHGLQTVVIYYHHAYGLPTDEKTLPQLQGSGLSHLHGRQVAPRAR